MVGAEYSIYKRDENGRRGAEIRKFTALTIQQRWSEPGKWTLESEGLERIPIGRGDAIIVYRNGELFFTGFVDAAEEICDEAQQGIITWTATGREMSALLERRLALPDPVGLQFGDAQDVLEDSAANAMRRFVDRNAGQSAAIGRRIGNLHVDIPAPDPNGEMWAFALKNLDKVCEEIGTGELSPEILWDDETGQMEFDVRARRELADTVVFAVERGTVLRWSKKSKLPKMNALWAASGGNGADQIIVSARSDESIAAFGRIEGYITDSVQVQEAKDDKPAVTAADVTAILQRKAQETLRTNDATDAYTVEVREGPTTMFHADWRCGDRVSCIIDGERIVSTIESVSISYNKEGEDVQATIGEVERGIFAELFDQIAEVQQGLETQQASAGGGSGGGSGISFNTIYPVGAIYLSMSATNPGTLFGGTWAQIAGGRVLVGQTASDSDFNTEGKTGGAKTHTLTTGEMPNHGHWISSAGRDDGNGTGCMTNTQDYGLWADAGSYTRYDPVKSYGRETAYIGGGAAHNNIQPYLTCYIWQRTA